METNNNKKKTIHVVKEDVDMYKLVKFLFHSKIFHSKVILDPNFESTCTDINAVIFKINNYSYI